MPNTTKIRKDIEKLMGRLEKAMNPINTMTIELFHLSGKRDAPPEDTAKFLKYHKGIKLSLKLAQEHIAKIRDLNRQLGKIVDSAKFKVLYKKANAAWGDTEKRLALIEITLETLEGLFKTLKPPVPVRPGK